MEDRPILQQFARKEVSVLKITLTQWKNHHHHHHHSANARLTKDQLELKPCTVHQQLCKAQWTCRRLQECLETLDVPVELCHEWVQLTNILLQVVEVKSQWDVTLEQSLKRDTLKSFRQNVAAILQRGKAPEWMQTLDSL